MGNFIIHEGKKAYVDLFIVRPGYIGAEVRIDLISMAGPQAAVQGIKSAILRWETVEIVKGDGKVYEATAGYSPLKVKAKRLPSGYLQVVMFDEALFNAGENADFDSKEIILYGKDEEECKKRLYRWMRVFPIPFDERWTDWLWGKIEKEALITNKGIAYRIEIKQQAIEEAIVEELDYLESLITGGKQS